MRDLKDIIDEINEKQAEETQVVEAAEDEKREAEEKKPKMPMRKDALKKEKMAGGKGDKRKTADDYDTTKRSSVDKLI